MLVTVSVEGPVITWFAPNHGPYAVCVGVVWFAQNSTVRGDAKIWVAR